MDLTRPAWYMLCLTGWTGAILALIDLSPNLAPCLGGGRVGDPSCLSVVGLLAVAFWRGMLIGLLAFALSEGIFRAVMALRGKP